MLEKIYEFIKKIIRNRMAKDYFWIFSGQTLASLLHLLSLAIIIHVIGHIGNGELIVIQSFSYLCGDLVNPQSYKSVIKFIAEAKGNSEKQNIINQGFWLDSFSGIIGVLAAIILMDPIFSWMRYDIVLKSFIFIYLPVVLFRHVNNGTAMGLLRYFGKFNVTIIIYDIIAFLRIIIYAILLLLNGKIIHFILCEAILEVSYALMIILAANHYSKKSGYYYLSFKKPNFKTYFIKFNLYSMLTSIADLSLGNVSGLIISGYLGVTLLSVFNTLGKIAAMFSRFTIPFTQVLYPTFCKYIGDKNFKRIKYFINIYTSCTVIITFLMVGIGYESFYIWSRYFGIEVQYLPETLVYIIYSMVTCIGIPYHTAHTAFGLVRLNLINVCVLNSIYCILLLDVIKHFGLMGVIVLLLIQAILMIIIKWVQELIYMKSFSKV